MGVTDAVLAVGADWPSSGYLMVGEDGGIFNFSDRPFAGSLESQPADPAHRLGGGTG
jgi:hypothetical protein